MKRNAALESPQRKRKNSFLSVCGIVVLGTAVVLVTTYPWLRRLSGDEGDEKAALMENYGFLVQADVKFVTEALSTPQQTLLSVEESASLDYTSILEDVVDDEMQSTSIRRRKKKWKKKKTKTKKKTSLASSRIAHTHWMDQYGKMEAVLSTNHVMALSEGRLVWHKLDIDGQHVDVLISSGEGTYHAVLPGERVDGRTTAWVLVEKDNFWTSSESGFRLINMVTEGPAIGSVLEVVEIPIDSVSDMFQHDDVVIVTSKTGEMVHLNYPNMTVESVYSFTNGSTVYAVNPELGAAILNTGGKCEIAKLGIEDGLTVVKSRRTLLGADFYHLIKWGNGYLTLDADMNSLVLLEDLDVVSSTGTVNSEVLWQSPEHNVFVKGLSVVNDIAFIGVSALDASETGIDWAQQSEIVFFDLVNMEELDRAFVGADGLLNGVSVAHLDPRSSYMSIEIDSDLLIPLRLKGDVDKPFQTILGQVDVTPVLELLDRMSREIGKDIWTSEGQETNGYLDAPEWHENNDNIKPGVEGILLIFSNLQSTYFAKFPWWENYFRPVLQPIFDEVFEPIFGKNNVESRYMRVQFAKMTPGADILRHRDKGHWADSAHRIHIPISVTPGVSFEASKPMTPVELEVGQVFEIDNREPHQVNNTGEEDRIHLIVDLWDEPIDTYSVLSPGQACDLQGPCETYLK